MVYRLLLRVERRMSGGVHLMGSYAWSRTSGTLAGNGFNLDDWLENTGPSGPSHLWNIAGIVQLPWRLDVGFNASYANAPPFSAYVGGIDFNGDGTSGDLLPGTTVNAFNRGMTRAHLERLVARFNATLAGSRDAQGAVIPRLSLPAHYALDDSLQALDVRVSRRFAVRGRLQATLIVEAFNVLNASNLSGFSGDLTTAAFGQPTSRVTQVFGSGGPRSLQFAGRLGF